MTTAILWATALSLLLVAGAISDVRTRRLPNTLALALLVLGLAHGFWLDGWSGLGWHAAHMGIALVVGMGLFAAGIIGGGDAKVYAGMASFFTLTQGWNLLLAVSIAGLFTIVSWMLLRRAAKKPMMEKPKDDFDKFPYGLAIAAGGILLAWWPLSNA